MCTCICICICIGIGICTCICTCNDALEMYGEWLERFPDFPEKPSMIGHIKEAC